MNHGSRINRNNKKRWEILHKSQVSTNESLIKILLKNRGIKKESEINEFLNPIDPMNIGLKELGVDSKELEKAITRIKKAKEKGEHVIIYGDYDADGITGTATLWETLHDIGVFVLPHIPERFSEGYGLNMESVKKLKEKDPNLSLIITVDHGITAGEKVGEAGKLGIDMIITDHHQKGKTPPQPLALIYTTKISGSALSWFFSREIYKKLKVKNFEPRIREKLLMAAIGTIADQLQLIGINRSIVKYGLKELNRTERPGLTGLFKESGISEIGTYEVGFIIAPRINSMGRLRHGLESLRLLCTKDKIRGIQIANDIGRVNLERQKIVDEVVEHAFSVIKENPPKVIVLSSEKYHEGVIGLAAARLVEKFYRPAIVISQKGDIAKASARSVAGFNIIEAIRKLDKYYLEGGGHPMAAGFSIKAENIEIFAKEINKIAEKTLTDEILMKRLNIDCQISMNMVNPDLMEKISVFEPTGLGNPQPVFLTPNVEVMSAAVVGKSKNHLKLKIKQDEYILDSIYFGGGEIYPDLLPQAKLEIVYCIEENVWNDKSSIQLKIKDLRKVT